MESVRPSHISLGAALPEANGALILLHGRGSSGSNIAQLAPAVRGRQLAFLAPNAPNGSWYPQRFLAPIPSNQPHIDQAIECIGNLVAEAVDSGVPHRRIALVGFSQGACLALEYLSRRLDDLGFVAALSGALMGPPDTDYSGGTINGTPVLLACAAEDAHIPAHHVRASAAAFTARGAAVTEHIFPGDAHTVLPFEIQWINTQLQNWDASR